MVKRMSQKKFTDKEINILNKAQHQNWFLTLNSSIKNRSLHSNKILFS